MEKNNYLLINQVSDEIGIFYLHVIQFFSTSTGININLNADVDTISSNNDLFELKKINVFNTTSTKKIDQILSSNDKSIVFSDYKNFKKYQKNYQTINGYNFSNDLKTFVKETLKIENQSLIEICIKNPQLILSETSKYLLNKDNYLKDMAIDFEVNKILEIRKKIFELKRSDNIQKLFLAIKEEVNYKKFSFLTY
ncbi:hypothetical protein N9Y54_01365 [Alphaproteobacteria bacterium]|nr:hypothetical protein [Alphaproteobacteria bacterium]